MVCINLFIILNTLDVFNNEQSRLINLTINHPLHKPPRILVASLQQKRDVHRSLKSSVVSCAIIILLKR